MNQVFCLDAQTIEFKTANGQSTTLTMECQLEHLHLGNHQVIVSPSLVIHWPKF